MSSRHSSRNAFTLVELMVVIIILGLLASLLVVTAGSVSSTAKSTEDAGHLRSIALANAAFASEHKER
ncbi:MAG: type II secretion system protein, partial [Planctomycetota bacterium]|nr:type II secretion system protein [Planctomycetota bacterium]